MKNLVAKSVEEVADEILAAIMVEYFHKILDKNGHVKPAVKEAALKTALWVMMGCITKQPEVEAKFWKELALMLLK